VPAGGRRERNPFDSVEGAKGSLFDRVERPHERSLSPASDSEPRRRGGGRRGARGGRRSDVSKPPPAHIDRYVPGQSTASPAPRGGRSGRERERADRMTVNGRPRKTQNELDQEMEDYWGTANAGAGSADNETVPNEPQQIAPASTAAAGDDDIDMIE
jgi:THO complex subunit 4